jgi:hypothetical protein
MYGGLDRTPASAARSTSNSSTIESSALSRGIKPPPISRGGRSSLSGTSFRNRAMVHDGRGHVFVSANKVVKQPKEGASRGMTGVALWSGRDEAWKVGWVWCERKASWKGSEEVCVCGSVSSFENGHRSA